MLVIIDVQWIVICRDTYQVYVGQSTDQEKLFQQHAHGPPNKMKDDVLKFKPFHMHFGLQIEYTTTRKYLVDRKEKNS